jgi:hypothetical protein
MVANGYKICMNLQTSLENATSGHAEADKDFLAE